MGLVPGRNISFSDHEGVAASFVVTELTREDSAGIKHYDIPVAKSHP